MVKSSAPRLLARNKNYKAGLLAGMILGNKLAKKKMRGGSSLGLKKALAILAGPWGWVWLAKHGSDKEKKELAQRLSKYEQVPTEYYDPAEDNDGNENGIDDEYSFLDNV